MSDIAGSLSRHAVLAACLVLAASRAGAKKRLRRRPSNRFPRPRNFSPGRISTSPPTRWRATTSASYGIPTSGATSTSSTTCTAATSARRLSGRARRRISSLRSEPGQLRARSGLVRARGRARVHRRVPIRGFSTLERSGEALCDRVERARGARGRRVDDGRDEGQRARRAISATSSSTRTWTTPGRRTPRSKSIGDREAHRGVRARICGDVQRVDASVSTRSRVNRAGARKAASACPEAAARSNCSSVSSTRIRSRNYRSSGASPAFA